jgi:hypothetical protein
VLAHRYGQLLLRDRRNLLILLGQVPVLGLLIAALFNPRVFSHPGDPREAAKLSRDAAQLLFLMVITTSWLGAIDAAREVIKERSVFARERAIGVSLGAYLSAKAVVLCALAAAQTVALSAIVFTIVPLHETGRAYIGVVLVLTLTSCVALGVGLLISSVVGSEDQASSLVPFVLIPQLILGGALKPVHQMSGPISALAALAFTRWSFAGVGSAAHLNDRGGGTSFASFYGTKFFDLAVPLALFVLAVFLAALVAAVAVQLTSGLWEAVRARRLG